MTQSTSPLLATKLYIVRPARDIVRRQRLEKVLDSIPRHRLTLIAAGAGFGKTTILGSWIERNAYPSAWLSLDPADSDPARFLAYLVGAFRTLYPEIGNALLSALQSTPLPPIESLMTSLVNDLSHISEDLLLVLDDYHTITSDEVHQGMSFLLEHAPPTLHVAMTSRVDPPFSLSRMRVRGQLLELRSADLRFSTDEADELLSGLMGITLSDDQRTALLEKTEGWIAGLHLAGLSMQGRDDLEAFIEGFTGADRFVLDYLIEEVLGRQSDEVQHVLMCLSVLDRFNGDLCERVSDCASGREMLHLLDRANLFLIPLDNRREWYRYHRLFADLLQHRLRRLHPDSIAGLHRRAAEWFESEGFIDEAFEHAYHTGDVGLLRRMLEKHWRTVLATSSHQATQLYLKSLSEEEVEASPKLMMVLAWELLLVGQVRELQRIATIAEELLEQENDDPDRDEVLGQFAILRSLVSSNSGDIEGTIHHAQRALQLIPERHPGSPFYSWHTSHLLINSILGLAYELKGEYGRAERTYMAVSAAARAAGDDRGLHSSLANEARVNMLAGKFGRLIELTEEMIAVRTEELLIASADAAAAAHQLRGMAYIEQWRIDEAVEEFETAVRMTPETVVEYSVDLKRFLIEAYVAQKNFAAAHRVQSEIESVTVHEFEPRLQRSIELSRARLMLHEGDITGALQWDRKYTDRVAEEKPVVRLHDSRSIEPLELMCHARILLRTGKAREAVDVVDEMFATSETGSTTFARLLHALALRAIVHERAGDADTALDIFIEALRMAAPERVLRPFMTDVEYVAPLLLRLLRTRHILDIPQEFIDTLAGYCSIDMERGELPVAELPGVRELEIGPLTTRELEILQLMARGYTNRKIAEKLYVSVNTVKTHASNLFDKLGAKNRVDALLKAREGGVLE